MAEAMRGRRELFRRHLGLERIKAAAGEIPGLIDQHIPHGAKLAAITETSAEQHRC